MNDGHIERDAPAMNLNRRHRSWYERVIQSEISRFFIGLLITIVLPALLIWNGQSIGDYDAGQTAAVIISLIAFAVCQFTLSRLLAFPGEQSASFIPFTILFAYLSLTLLAIFFRLDVSRLFVFVSGVLCLVWGFINFSLARRFIRLKFAVVPVGDIEDVKDLPNVDVRVLSSPDLGRTRYDGIVADLHSLSDGQWERFLTTCALADIPVYHVGNIIESLTGRVKIDSLSENNIGALLPSQGYKTAKRTLDLLLAVVLLPVLLPLILVIAVLVKMDSPGPVFFVQERVGLGNKPFRMWKFRSMRVSDDSQARFASDDDERITRFGCIIRKFRIDELPQIFNVILGNMSFIGPRPEQRAFVEAFDRQIPFYSYRHVVKPGISGWAQVTQGYVADHENTVEKLQRDLYYIKHFSLWLDLLITLKTVRTVLTGFGAR